MDDRHIPSIDELFAGRMKDGSSPPLQSGKLYEHWDKPLPGIDETKTKSQLTAEELHHQVDLVLLEDLDLIRDFAVCAIKIAQQIADETPAKPDDQPKADSPGRESRACEAEAKPDDQPKAESPGRESRACEAEAKPDDQPKADSPGRESQACEAEAEANDKPKSDSLRMPGLRGMPSPRAPRDVGHAGITNPAPPQDVPLEKLQAEQRNAEYQARVVGATNGKRKRKTTEQLVSVLTKPQALAFAERCARLLLAVTEKRAAVAHRLVDSALTVDMKTSFMWDRAHGVVAATLLHMDETFDKLGFGAWMPFRYPDQWLMFCGVMQRVLAANGLIHSKHADIYRRLMEETPPVEWPEGIEDTQERIDKLKTPEGWGRCWINRGASTLTIMKQRLEKEVWNKPPP